MTKNTESTRFYSSKQEQSVAKAMGATQQANSGAGAFAKGDVYNKSASMLFECKTATSNKDSFSIKRDWLEKVEEERKSKRLDNSCVVINFGPDAPYSKNYYIINERLMKFLIDKLEEENQ